MIDFTNSFKLVAEQAVDLSISREQFTRAAARAYLEEHLARTKGNRSAAARAMGTHRNTLQRWIRELGLPEKKGPWAANNPRFGKGEVA